MIYNYCYSDVLLKLLDKLKKKDRNQYDILCKKRDEVLENPHRFKNLRHSLSGRKRVHIDSNFVLVFKR
ncbi:hypothetical protein COV18_07235 [Candidatus Woesearchaeota archaeon CG10_big_fil_rev_8_21_14_0_10_37_12]|nr:MAG: hypothetical protein COV18_07235 [Candidatus Woesearchaeota archaeon CG10_big_fil_rev_8_21_14_0_10_37_12]